MRGLRGDRHDLRQPLQCLRWGWRTTDRRPNRLPEVRRRTLVICGPDAFYGDLFFPISDFATISIVQPLPCPKCGNSHVSVLFPKEGCDPSAAPDGDHINDTCDTILVCGHCGYLGPEAESDSDT